MITQTFIENFRNAADIIECGDITCDYTIPFLPGAINPDISCCPLALVYFLTWGKTEDAPNTDQHVNPNAFHTQYFREDVKPCIDLLCETIESIPSDNAITGRIQSIMGNQLALHSRELAPTTLRTLADMMEAR